MLLKKYNPVNYTAVIFGEPKGQYPRTFNNASLDSYLPNKRAGEAPLTK